MIKELGKLILYVILISFLSTYVLGLSGYYEYAMRQKSVITNEKIKEFEQDIKDDKELDLESYLDKDDVNYSNKITTLVYRVSDNSNKLARKVIKTIFNKLGSLIEE